MNMLIILARSSRLFKINGQGIFMTINRSHLVIQLFFFYPLYFCVFLILTLLNILLILFC